VRLQVVGRFDVTAQDLLDHQVVDADDLIDSLTGSGRVIRVAQAPAHDVDHTIDAMPIPGPVASFNRAVINRITRAPSPPIRSAGNRRARTPALNDGAEL
jgi:hypothetical protein